MFPFCDSPRPMDMPLYQQLLPLSPPSPKPDQSSSFYYYPCSPPFAAADASYQLASAAAFAPALAVIDSPELSTHPSMEQPPAPKHDPGNAQGAGAAGVGLDAASASRKDRHSKIRTAGGMRDRRMRLSLDVSVEFFALQDTLGFDKGSQTVRWLLNAAKPAIQELSADDASSECVEDGSSSLSVDVKHNPTTEELGGGGDQQEKGNGCGEGKKPAKARRATTTPKAPRKSGNAHPVLDKETRAKARERARERTKEKHRMRWVKLSSAIDVEAAGEGRDGSNSINNLNHSSSSSMDMAAAAAELEVRCSLSLNNGGRTTMASEPSSDMALAFGNGGYVGGSSNYCQEQWELGGVVFANSRFY